ncbi:MAG: hypothetical protein PVI26_01410 [Chitinispirillia bacterium]|jgi:hypothetical protein
MKIGTAFFITILVIFALKISTYAQYGQYSSRSLLEKKIYYIANGKINTCNYWSLPLGRYDCTLNRFFAGEGKIDVEATLNFTMLSSGYVEGHGYGTKGKIGSEARFAYENGDSLVPIDLKEIDYVYDGGRTVKLINQPESPLILSCEANRLSINSMKIMIWVYDKTFHELKHTKDVDHVTAFSFTKEGAVRALKAQGGR